MLLNFFFEMPNIWVGCMMLNKEKKGDGLNKESQRRYFSVFVYNLGSDDAHLY